MILLELKTQWLIDGDSTNHSHISDIPKEASAVQQNTDRIPSLHKTIPTNHTKSTLSPETEKRKEKALVFRNLSDSIGFLCSPAAPNENVDQLGHSPSHLYALACAKPPLAAVAEELGKSSYIIRCINNFSKTASWVAHMLCQLPVDAESPRHLDLAGEFPAWMPLLQGVAREFSTL